LLQRGVSADTIFQELLADGLDHILEDCFCKKVATIPEAGVSPEHARLVFYHIDASGIRRRNFLRVVEVYYRCIKDIAITTDFEIGAGKTIRKIETNEYVEVIDGPRSDEKLSLLRIKGKAMRDGTIGWMSLQGNQGTSFLKKVDKPCYACAMDVPLDRDFETDSSAPIRKLRAGEVVEHVEGPREETFLPVNLAKVKAVSDGAVGWIVVQDKHGVNAELCKTFVCSRSIAMTDKPDIATCEAVRKLDVDEVIEVLEGPLEQKGPGTTRLLGKAVRDGSSGWITVKGNAGTVYAVESMKHYAIRKAVALKKQIGGEAMRTLDVGEVVMITEGPREDRLPPISKLKVRAIMDNVIGWVTVKGQNLTPWTQRYTCVGATVMQATREIKNAPQIRRLQKGEVVELLDGPLFEGGDTSVLRIRARAEKDGAEGWVTLRGNQGKAILESIPP